MSKISEESPSLSLVDLALKAISHRRLLIGLPIIAGLIGAVISFVMPPSYTATTRILPPQQTSSSLMQALSSLGSAGGIANAALGIRNPIEMYVSLLRSRTIADNIIEKFKLQTVFNEDLMTDARRGLAIRTAVNWGRDGIITIEVDDRDPKRAADIANAYVEELAKLQQKLLLTEASARRDFFERQTALTKKMLGEAEASFRDLQQKTGIVALQEQGKATIEAMARVQAEITERQVRLEAAKSFATERNPDILRLREEVKALQDQLARLERMGEGSTSGIFLQSKKAPELSLEYVRAFRNVKYHETVFEMLAKQYELARLEEAREATPVQVVDTAVPPERRSWPKRRLIVTIAVLLGLLVALAMLFAKSRLIPEWRSKRAQYVSFGASRP